jgi:hypothetical protein
MTSVTKVNVTSVTKDNVTSVTKVNVTSTKANVTSATKVNVTSVTKVNVTSVTRVSATSTTVAVAAAVATVPLPSPRSHSRGFSRPPSRSSTDDYHHTRQDGEKKFDKITEDCASDAMERLQPDPTRGQCGTSDTSEFDAAYEMEMQNGFVWAEHDGPINNRETDFSKRGDGKPETTDAPKRKRDCDQQRSDGKPETTDASKLKRKSKRDKRKRKRERDQLEADVTVVGRKFAMSEFVTNLPPIEKLSSVARKALRSNGCVKADALVAPPATPPSGDLGTLMG